MGASIEKIVIVNPNVVDYLDDLAMLLFVENYFRFMESAENYVNEIFDFILTVPSQISYDITNEKSKYYNKNLKYCRYRANKKTTWFIYFERNKNRYYIEHIENSHTLANYGYKTKKNKPEN
jgi:hypothetical protein